MMSRVAEITALLTEIASRLQTGLPLTESSLPAISSLNQTLNLNEESRVRVFDTALSLMCFKAPQVFDSMIENLVGTIVSVLLSSISCKVLRFQKEEFLQIGSSISRYDCGELIKACLDVFGRLEGHGNLSHLLFRAVLRVAISASCHQSLFPLPNIVIVEPSYQKNTAFSKLHSLLPEEISVSNEMLSRLFLWYLEPLTLKDDISRILSESSKRPFLSLKKELYERMTWRSIILCMVLSPTMFIETRTLLHSWFLLTGLTSILELQIEIVSSVLDVLQRPMWWGMSMEVGSKLPFSQAYFLDKHHLLLRLAGPLSCESLLGLVHLIRGLVSHAENHSDPIFKQTSIKARMIDHKSTWALLMAFPVWFYFASALLFSGKNCPDMFLPRCITGAVKTQTHDIEQNRASAARYLAWILIPCNEYHSDLLVNCLIEISISLEHCCLDTHNVTAGFQKKLMTPKDHDYKNTMAAKEYDGRAMGLWLKQFHDCHVSYWNKIANNSESAGAKAPKILSLRQNLLFRRIPLGIFIGCSNIDEEACELLLHYAATGAILPYDNKDLMTLSEKSDERKEAIEGAHLVFSLFDVIEDMSDSIFETEESSHEFICRLRVKVGRFLVKCVEKLLQLNTDEDNEEMLMLMDLRRRLSQWRHQGGEGFQGYKALDEIFRALNFKLSSYEKD
ncbi:hypothetical protein BVC80_8473g1 [Macleaya cordata]|uniref:Uncharacterized protein n=1 Tax=Macleaya cordata TaxID=56857 RepID=A0A200R0S4_MACCD|nr:hypothetical protein BVC80_8473g1 [Macleaya cordata]